MQEKGSGVAKICVSLQGERNFVRRCFFPNVSYGARGTVMHRNDVDFCHGSFVDKKPKKDWGCSALCEAPKLTVLRQDA